MQARRSLRDCATWLRVGVASGAMSCSVPSRACVKVGTSSHVLGHCAAISLCDPIVRSRFCGCPVPPSVAAARPRCALYGTPTARRCKEPSLAASLLRALGRCSCARRVLVSVLVPDSGAQNPACTADLAAKQKLERCSTRVHPHRSCFRNEWRARGGSVPAFRLAAAVRQDLCAGSLARIHTTRV